MEIKVRTMLGQAIDVFKEYIETKGNLETDYNLEVYMQVILDYIKMTKEYINQLEIEINELNIETEANENDWNKLKEYLNNVDVVVDYSENYDGRFINYDELLDKMQKLEQGSDSNE